MLFRSKLIINITPLTELAVRQAGISGTSAAAPEVVEKVNANVAKAFGLAGVELTGEVTPTNSGEFDGRNGLTNGEKYGLALAKLSGLDALNAGSIATSLAQLAENLNGDTLRTEGAVLVDQGRQKALSALKSNNTTFKSSGSDGDVDTTLNRQLLGDVVVKEQTPQEDGSLEVKGTALPGSSVTITWPDGTSDTVTADDKGEFSVSSAQPQPKLDVPLRLQGEDGLEQPAESKPPSTPKVDTGNGEVVTGKIGRAHV